MVLFGSRDGLDNVRLIDVPDARTKRAALKATAFSAEMNWQYRRQLRDWQLGRPSGQSELASLECLEQLFQAACWANQNATALRDFAGMEDPDLYPKLKETK